VQADDLCRLVRGDGAPGLAQQRVDHEAAAHADAAVDGPHRQDDAHVG